MPKLLAGLAIVIGFLLIVQIVDRHREPQQLKAVFDEMRTLADATRAQTEEMRKLRQAFEATPRVVAAQPTATPGVEAPAAAPDGKPKLGVNFLLPPLSDTLHAERIGGDFKEFSKTVPQTLNYLLNNLADISTANGLMNDTLCDQDLTSPDLWRAALAESVVVSDEWKTFTFRLRPGVRWHVPPLAKEPGFTWLAEEREVTAADFVLRLDLIRNPDVQCPALKGYYETCTGAKAVDDRTLVVTWAKSEYTNLDATLGLSPYPSHVYTRNADGSPIPAHQVGVVFNRHWFDERQQFVGCGAFRLDRFEPGKTLRFARNDGYWGAGFHFRSLTWDGTVMQDDPQLVAFKNGQVHIQSLLPTQYKSEILDRKEPRFAAPVTDDPKAGRAGPFGWERFRGTSYRYVGWNMRRPQFADRETRHALAYAFPRQRVIDEVFIGLGRPQIGTIHPDSPYAPKGLERFDHDPAKAKALLAQAGWADRDGDGWLDRPGPDGKSVALRFKVTHFAASASWINMLAIYRDTLKQLGVELASDPVEGNEWDRRMGEKDFDGICAGWSIGLDADYVQLWHSKYADEPKSSNHCGLKNAELDQLADDLRATFELDRRKAVVQRIERILWSEMPYLFISSGEGVIAWQNRKADGNDLRSEFLGGVSAGLDRWHPLYNRSRPTWYITATPESR